RGAAPGARREGAAVVARAGGGVERGLRERRGGVDAGDAPCRARRRLQRVGDRPLTGGAGAGAGRALRRGARGQRGSGCAPGARRARYFRRIGDDEVVNDRLRPHVRFDVHNLLAATGGRELDLILCRNVLIYFDEARRAEALARLVRALKPGGWLLVGYSETLR